MTQVTRRARVPYSAEQMFTLVNDVESYPKFLHWCRGARIVSSADEEIVAEEADEMDEKFGSRLDSLRERFEKNRDKAQ